MFLLGGVVLSWEMLYVLVFWRAEVWGKEVILILALCSGCVIGFVVELGCALCFEGGFVRRVEN